jgi:hypothetical protein
MRMARETTAAALLLWIVCLGCAGTSERETPDAAPPPSDGSAGGTGGTGGAAAGARGGSTGSGGAAASTSTGSAGATAGTSGATGGNGGATAGTSGAAGGSGGATAGTSGATGGNGGATGGNGGATGGSGGATAGTSAGAGGSGGATGIGAGRGGIAGGRAGATGGSASVAGGSGGAPSAACGVCTTWSQPVGQGHLSSRLPELSGLAASRVHPGLLYTHNDSGDSAHFFAMDESGVLKAELRLDGATALDWEDIAVGPCPSGSCVHVADIGDNSAARDEYTIYRVPEPQVMPSDGAAVSAGYDRLTFVYPDNNGSYNSEALLVHPQTGRIFVIVKMGGRPAVYEMPPPLTPGPLKTLVASGTLRLPAADSIVTGADFHPCGDRMLVRTTESLYELSAPGKPVETLFAATPVKVPVATEPQGEAVTYSLDGRRYFTSSETGPEPPPVNVVSCQAPPP